MICVAANPSIDRLFEVNRFAHGAIHRPVAVTTVAGGKALNTARAAKALGAEPLVMALLAGHAGAWIADALAAAGVRLRATWIQGETRSCLSAFDRASGDLTEFYEDGPAVDSGTWRAFVTDVVEASEAGWLAICGSLPAGVPSSAYADLVRSASARSASVAIDASGEVLARALEAGPHLVKVNETEAADLLAASTTADTEIPAKAPAPALLDLAGSGSCTAVVTSGAHGATLAGPSGLLLQGRPPHQGRYPVGSGDCFLAGLLAANERGLDWHRALALAIAAGAANAEIPGAAVLDPTRVEDLAARVHVESF
jgi:1-phosphofructokinase family hexose kinase